jgi:hypothetical protein
MEDRTRSYDTAGVALRIILIRYLKKYLYENVDWRKLLQHRASGRAVWRRHTAVYREAISVVITTIAVIIVLKVR